MAVVPAAGTQDGEGGQGGVAVLADPTPVTAGEDFTPWNPAHANRLLPPGRARTVLRSTLEVYCEGLIADDRETLLLECPFSLGGLAKMERQVGRHAYQPLAHAFDLPWHPNCPIRKRERSAPCRPHGFTHCNALLQHALDNRGDHGGLHAMLCEEFLTISPSRRRRR
jgi:hypothetical protein